MGRDKALLDWGGSPLLFHVLSSLTRVQPAFTELLIIGDRCEYRGFGARVVADQYPGAGPLGGIATALRACSTEAIFVVACDMPFLRPELIGAMIQLASSELVDAVVPRRRGDDTGQGPGGVFETLHAVYRPSCLPAIENRLARGERQVVSVLRDVRVLPVTESWLRKRDPDLRSFVNVNRPEEYAQAAKSLSGGSAGRQLCLDDEGD